MTSDTDKSCEEKKNQEKTRQSCWAFFKESSQDKSFWRVTFGQIFEGSVEVMGISGGKEFPVWNSRRKIPKMEVCMHAHSLSCVWLFTTPWTVACQALLSLGFSRQEFWCCLPFSLPGYLPDPGIKLTSLAPPALSGRFSTTEPLYDLPPKTAMITQCL